MWLCVLYRLASGFIYGFATNEDPSYGMEQGTSVTVVLRAQLFFLEEKGKTVSLWILVSCGYLKIMGHFGE